MFRVIVTKKDKYYSIELENDLVRTKAILQKGLTNTNVEFAVDRANELIDALINAGFNVEPALGLKEDRGE